MWWADGEIIKDSIFCSLFPGIISSLSGEVREVREFREVREDVCDKIRMFFII